MIVKLMTEHHLEFLNFKGGYLGSSESTLVNMPHCWKSHDSVQITNYCKCIHLCLLKYILNFGQLFLLCLLSHFIFKFS